MADIRVDTTSGECPLEAASVRVARTMQVERMPLIKGFPGCAMFVDEFEMGDIWRS